MRARATRPAFSPARRGSRLPRRSSGSCRRAYEVDRCSPGRACAATTPRGPCALGARPRPSSSPFPRSVAAGAAHEMAVLRFRGSQQLSETRVVQCLQREASERAMPPSGLPRGGFARRSRASLAAHTAEQCNERTCSWCTGLEGAARPNKEVEAVKPGEVSSLAADRARRASSMHRPLANLLVLLVRPDAPTHAPRPSSPSSPRSPLVHAPMPLELVAAPKRLAAPRLGAHVLTLGAVRADVLGEVGRLGERGGAAGVRAGEGARAGVGACEQVDEREGSSAVTRR